MTSSGNFDFLSEHDPVFVQLTATAEQVFASDPNTTLVKLRQFGEALARALATRAGVEFDRALSQSDLLFRIGRELQLDADVRRLFHTLRVEGNRATHGFHTQHREAIEGLRVARELAVWYHRAFGRSGATFKPGPFRKPADPSESLLQLQTELSALRGQLSDSHQQLENNQQLAQLLEREKEEFVALAEQMDVEARSYRSLAQQHEQALEAAKADFEQRIATLQAELNAQPDKARKITQQVRRKKLGFDPNEDLTRLLIDQQLKDAGWEADSELLSFKKGARPQAGRNQAIAEWPTPSGRADYVLFAGLVPLAIVEAKRERVNVADCIPQAERYARELRLGELEPAWHLAGHSAGWDDGQNGSFAVPFAFACNGRARFKQLEELSGIWFRDLRALANRRRVLDAFHTPADLLDQLRRHREAAEAMLRDEGFAYLRLYDYQVKAIVAVEQALTDGQRTCLLAMATGTGKTRTAIGLMYRLLKAERFRRILFLVDRSALGNQAQDAFNETKLEQNHTLAQIYDIKSLGDMAAEAETRVQVATVQAMISRVFRSDEPPAVGEYDCIIVDEAHRGYTLDAEMSEGEIAVRDIEQYLSQYRRVLDYFDAVRIGLTATPAKHTTDIFGKPVYIYSYREAVADDRLIDHEPPIRYETLLSQNGIHFGKGETVHVINTATGEVDAAELEDELDFNVESFNRRVITPGFDEVICQQLAKELDPSSEEKTLIFCVNQIHAERVKNLLDAAFGEIHGEDYNQAAVKVITGKSDKVDQLIRQYKNERHPNIAITVDLLTTGIDVPQICNLVFMRRVRSRILYEQMKGRATRRCDEIGKTVFRIYDPVDLYAALEDVDTMKPLVKDPHISLEQLADELQDPRSFEAPGHDATHTHADDVLDEFSQRVMRVLRKAQHQAERKPEIRDRLGELEQAWGVAPAQLHQHLHQLGAQQAAQFIRTQPQLLNQLALLSGLLGSDRYPIIASHQDQLLLREQTPDGYKAPGDYLEGFNAFIRNQLNQSVALSVVVNRPRDLTREQLREIKLLLDQNGFNEAGLKSAWRNQTNQEIAASIVGYIRRAALGEALIPFEQRVDRAMQAIYALHAWTPAQRKWLDRIATQLCHEVVIDEDFINRRFADDGGATRLNRVLDEQLPEVMETLATRLWAG